MARFLRFSLPNPTKNMEAWPPFGQCDITKLQVPITTLQKQYRQSSNSTYWCGALVWEPALDPLNDQVRLPPLANPDPPWVRMPRPNATWQTGIAPPNPTPPYGIPSMKPKT